MVDASNAMLAVAREKAKKRTDVKIEFVQSEIERMPFESETFAFATSFDVFCSVTDPSTALSETIRVLKPRGKLLLVEHGAISCNGQAGSCERSPNRLDFWEWWLLNYRLAFVTACLLKPLFGISLVRDHVSLIEGFPGVHVLEKGTVTDIGDGMYRWFILQKQWVV